MSDQPTIARELTERLTSFCTWADSKPPAAKTGVNLSEQEARCVLAVLQQSPPATE